MPCHARAIRCTHHQHQLPAKDRHMQTATLNERGVTLLDRSLVFVPSLVCLTLLLGAPLSISRFTSLRRPGLASAALDLRENNRQPPLEGFGLAGPAMVMVGSAAATAATANAPCLASAQRRWRSRLPTNEWLPPAQIPGLDAGGCAAACKYSTVALEDAPFPPQSSRGDSYAGSRFPCISTPRHILHCDLQIARICAAVPCAAMPCHALSSADCPREHCGPPRWREANRHGGDAGAKAGFSPSFPPFSGMGIKMGLAILKASDTLARRFFFFFFFPDVGGGCLFSCLPPIIMRTMHSTRPLSVFFAASSVKKQRNAT